MASTELDDFEKELNSYIESEEKNKKQKEVILISHYIFLQNSSCHIVIIIT
jgi:hypothetical protein